VPSAAIGSPLPDPPCCASRARPSSASLITCSVPGTRPLPASRSVRPNLFGPIPASNIHFSLNAFAQRFWLLLPN
jgi:hypothetical protein